MKTDDKSSIIEQHLSAIEKKDKSSRNFKLLAIATIALGCIGGWVLSKSMTIKSSTAASKIVQVKNTEMVQEQATVVKDVVKLVRKPKIVLKPSEEGEVATDSVAVIVEEGSEWFAFPNTTEVVFDEQEIVREYTGDEDLGEERLDTATFKQYTVLKAEEAVDTAKQWFSEEAVDTAKHIALQAQ